MKRGIAQIAVVVAGLFVSSVAGATAQSAAQAAPVEVTGTGTEGPCPGGRSEMVGDVEQNRGYVCLSEWSMSDPRLAGTFSRAWNLDFYKDGTDLIFGYTTGRLESAEGAWQQRPGLRARFAGEPDLFDDIEVLVLDGEGGYDGLVAIVYVVGQEDGEELRPARLHGYVIEGEYPPSDHLAR